MSTGRSNAMDALPRASFLTYFRNPGQPKRRTNRCYQWGRPAYQAHCAQAPPLPRIPEDAVAEDYIDEESCMGDSERFEHCDDDEQHQTEWRWSDVAGLVGYTLLVLFIVLNLDFLFSTHDTNTGSASNEMHFCLSEQSQFAPTSRLWRYVAKHSDAECRTRTMTIHVNLDKERELLSEDIITGKNAKGSACGHMVGKIRQELCVDQMGDDLAEEGELRRDLPVGV